MIAGLAALAGLASALLAGTFFAFSFFAMRALSELPAAQAVAAMRSINRVILGSAFMPVFFGAAALGLGLAVFALVQPAEPARAALLVGGLAQVAGCFLVTLGGNVPLNRALDAADARGDAPEAAWAAYAGPWLRWNHVRTAACLLSAAAFAIAI